MCSSDLRALASRPTIIFADEPTGNLDSRTGAEVLSFMRRAVSDLGQTIVMVTHEPNAAAYADRVVFLADGTIVDEMTEPSPDRVLDRAAKERRLASAGREAVVADFPGVTRDAKEGLMLYHNHRITLIDTGGLSLRLYQLSCPDAARLSFAPPLSDLCIYVLRGRVERRDMKRLAEDIAESVSGVRNVRNELRVEYQQNTAA